MKILMREPALKLQNFGSSSMTPRSRDRVLRATRRVILRDGNMAACEAEQTRRRELERRLHLPGTRPTVTIPGCFAAAGVLLVTSRCRSGIRMGSASEI